MTYLQYAAHQFELEEADEEAVDAAMDATALARRVFIGDNSTRDILSRYPILKSTGQVSPYSSYTSYYIKFNP